MEALTKLLFYTHLIGFSAVAGGLLFQFNAKTKTIGKVILNSTRWQAVSGSLLYYLMKDDVRPSVVGLKIIGVTVLLTLVELNRKKSTISTTLYHWLLVIVALQTLAAIFVSME